MAGSFCFVFFHVRLPDPGLPRSVCWSLWLGSLLCPQVLSCCGVHVGLKSDACHSSVTPHVCTWNLFRPVFTITLRWILLLRYPARLQPFGDTCFALCECASVAKNCPPLPASPLPPIRPLSLPSIPLQMLVGIQDPPRERDGHDLRAHVFLWTVLPRYHRRY